MESLPRCIGHVDGRAPKMALRLMRLMLVGDAGAVAEQAINYQCTGRLLTSESTLPSWVRNFLLCPQLFWVFHGVGHS
jgi:hypothetical protein